MHEIVRLITIHADFVYHPHTIVRLQFVKVGSELINSIKNISLINTSCGFSNSSEFVSMYLFCVLYMHVCAYHYVYMCMCVCVCMCMWHCECARVCTSMLSLVKACSHRLLCVCLTVSQLAVMWCDVTPYQLHTSHGSMAAWLQFQPKNITDFLTDQTLSSVFAMKWIFVEHKSDLSELCWPSFVDQWLHEETRLDEPLLTFNIFVTTSSTIALLYYHLAKI